MVVDLLTGIGKWSGPWFWAPMAGWTVVAMTGIVALKVARGLHPLFTYRLRQALLLSLPVALGVRPWVAGLGSTDVLPTVPILPHFASLVVLPGSPVSTPAPAPTVYWLGVGVVLAAVGGAIRMTILGRRLLEVGRLERDLIPVRDPRILQMVWRLKGELGVDRPVSIRVGPVGCVPMTFRFLRPVVVVPEALLHDLPLFELAVAHELIHVRRGDYAWRLLEWGASAMFAFHPLVWMLSRSVDLDRETSCDAEVVGSDVGDPKAYGQLLLSLAGRAAPVPWVAAGMVTHSSKLKQRVMTMTRFIEAPRSANRSLRSVAAALVMMVVVVLAGACAGHVPEVQDSAVEISAAQLTSSFGLMADETREAALQRLGVQMEYLNERIEATRAEVQAFQDRGEDHPRHVWERYELLSSMYLQRLETFETLKLEAETDRRLGEL